MSTVLDLKLIPKVKALLVKYGMSVTFTLNSREDYDVNSGAVDELRPTTVTGKITPPQVNQGPRPENTDESSRIEQTYLSPDITKVPTVGSKMSGGGKTWRVVSVGAIYSGEDICLYELTLEA